MSDSKYKPNIVVLSVDSLQYGYFSEALSEIASTIGAVEFTNAMATANQTSSAMPGLAAGVFDDRLSTQGLPTSGEPAPLAEVLAENGYGCGLWSDNFLFGSEYNYDRGFAAGNQGEPTRKKRLATRIKKSPLQPAFGMFEWLYFNVAQRVEDFVSGDSSFYLSADQLHKSALDWFEKSQGPNFCWIHYMDTHHPYEPPREYLADVSLTTEKTPSELGKLSRDVIKSNGEGYSSDDIRDVEATYRACCAYIRDAISEFIEDLISMNHFDPDHDVLVLTADHGERLNPTDYPSLGHFPTSFWEECIHVPLAICHPRWNAQTIHKQVSLIDVMPTILDAANLSTLSDTDGTAASTPEKLASEYAISISQPPNTGRTYRSIRHESGWKLFGLELESTNKIVLTQFDPADALTEEVVQESDVAGDSVGGEHADLWNELWNELELRGQGLPVEDSQNVDTQVPEEHLKNLGYIE
ncbi:sulfatase-like hydrolase/transferase [Haladaptatus halobius]|uniref:sulfatase-like hydrolase/transferase n=1 Tax=Haladaptatus halobius TaxID=2884875 RepID=UPI001D0A3E73|nr:sulfatase-like hydrolase/transferase [Haladaptatus halobius]